MAILAFAILSLLFRITSSAEVSITDSPQYQSQRPCARDCFYLGAFKGPDRIALYIDCDPSPIENNCFCRSDLQGSVDNYLTSCVNSACGKKTLDITNAVSIYDAYCTGLGYTREEESAPVTTASLDSGTYVFWRFSGHLRVFYRITVTPTLAYSDDSALSISV